MQNRNSLGNRKRTYIAGAVLAAVGLCIVFLTKSDVGEIKRMVSKGNWETELENRETEAVDKDQFFIILNTDLTMKEGNSEANLSITNPLYSAYNFRIKIILEGEEETLLYSSDLVLPGTYLGTVSLQKELRAGKYEATVHYTFYGETQKVIIGEYMVPITIAVSK